jgi:hypothetical protein
MRDSLPRRLPGGELQRVRWNLDRWDAHLEQSDDPYPDIGAFMSLARDVFEDRMVTAEETLLGVTGSGKTFTIANVIEQVQRPTLILAPTRPWRRSSTASCGSSSRTTRWSTSSPTTTTTSPRPTCRPPTPTSRRTPRSTSTSSRCACPRPRPCWSARTSSSWRPCRAIYGLGDPEAYLKMVLHLSRGEIIDQRAMLRQLAELQYRATRSSFPRHLPGARRRDRHLPGGVRRRGGAGGAVRRRDREPVACSTRSPARCCARCRATRLPEDPLRHAARGDAERRRADQGRAARAAGPAARPTTSWSRRSAWSSAPSSTWR